MPAESSTADHAAVRVMPPRLFLRGLVPGLLIDLGWRYVWPAGLPDWTSGWWLEWWPGWAPGIGAGFVLAGASLARWSFVSLRRAGTSGDPRTPTRQLVQTGPFAWSRNPVYIAMVLLYLGAELLIGGRWGIVLLPVWVIVLDRAVVRPEERYLHQRFGPAYAAYCNT